MRKLLTETRLKKNEPGYHAVYLWTHTKLGGPSSGSIGKLSPTPSSVSLQSFLSSMVLISPLSASRFARSSSTSMVLISSNPPSFLTSMRVEDGGFTNESAGYFRGRHAHLLHHHRCSNKYVHIHCPASAPLQRSPHLSHSASLPDAHKSLYRLMHIRIIF